MAPGRRRPKSLRHKGLRQSGSFISQYDITNNPHKHNNCIMSSPIYKNEDD